MALPWGAIIGAGASILGSGMEYAGQQSANQANVDIMREQMAWQERMSSTAHQREVKDLVSAGLNPILSAKYQGASTPSTALATEKNPWEGSRATSIAIGKAVAEIKMLKASAKLASQQTQTNRFKAAKTLFEAEKEQGLANSATAKGRADVLKYNRRTTNTGQAIDWFKEYRNIFNPFEKRK
jgi:hypothetical protein